MEKAELEDLWLEEKNSMTEDQRQAEEQIAREVRIAERRATKKLELVRSREAAAAQYEAERLQKLPEIITEARDFHAKQLKIFARLQPFLNEGTNKYFSVTNVSRKVETISEPIPLGEIDPETEAQAIVTLYSEQLLRGRIFGSKWQEPKPNNFTVTLQAVPYNSFAPVELRQYSSTSLSLSSSILEKSDSELHNLRPLPSDSSSELEAICRVFEFDLNED